MFSSVMPPALKEELVNSNLVVVEVLVHILPKVLAFLNADFACKICILCPGC